MSPAKGYPRGAGVGVSAYSRRGRSAALAVAALVLTAVVWASGETSGLFSGSGATERDVTSSAAVVERVIDGDTFVARDKAGKDLGRVRILGLDAPELGRDDRGAQCWAHEATAAAKDRLQGRTVTLTADPRQPDRDDYGRLLRYVDTPREGGGAADISENLIRDGAARRTTRPGQHQRHPAYARAEDEARREKAGLWAQC